MNPIEHNNSDPVVLHTRVVTGTGGGPDKTILNSPRYLQSHGYQALCAYMHPPQDPGFDELRRRAEESSCPIIPVPDQGPWDVRVVRRMLKICRDENVSIWHAHDYKSNALGLLLRRFWPMRLVTTVHGWVKYTRRTPIYYGIDRWCLRHYDRVICVSEDLRQVCFKSGVGENRCTVIDNAVDADQYKRRMSTTAAKRLAGFQPDRFLIGAVGRLSSEKGFGLLIEAVDRLIRGGHLLELAIVGEGDVRPKLESQITTTADPERFHLLGYRSDLIELYQALDFFVLSSLREGLPNVLLEAMAMKVPVVATRVAGVPRLIQHEQNGLLVDPNSVEQLTAALSRLIRDEPLRKCLKQAGRQTIEERYSFSRRMQKIKLIYDELLNQDQPQLPAESQQCVS